MAVYTVNISDTSNFGDVNVGDGSTFASLSVSAGRGPKGDGFTGGTYNASTGVVTFTSNEDLGFSTGDLRSFTGGSYNSTTGEVTFTSNTGVGFTTGDIRGGSIDETLGQIAASKAVTAADVFVYDTSKDSDGGAWRKRTQHTSWYNETLNTATRGSRREFPAVAVIVAESNKVTIYDGDDPSLPMWMVFNRSNDGYFLSTSQTATSVVCFDGSLVFGTNSTGIRIVNFIGDFGRFIRNVSDDVLTNISTRNSGTVTTPVGTNYIVNGAVNDVAMTVLPDAPIDPATGLPVPTIAVATDGGVSVIKDDGTVVDSASTAGFKNVNFDAGNSLYYGSKTFNLTLIRSTSYESDGFSGTTFFGAIGLNNLETNPVLIGGDTEKNSYAFAKDGEFFGGGDTSSGFTRRGFARYLLGTTQMTCFTTSTYNTGWMPGDIKGAFLADTDDTDLVGSGELVTNGTFDTDVSGWTDFDPARGTTSWDSGTLKLTNDGTGNHIASQQITGLTIGQTYVLTVDITASVGTNADVRVGNSNGTSNLGATSSGVGFKTITFKPQLTSVWIQPSAIGGVGAGVYANFDNISVKLADADRSVNNNGLIVNGTVTRTPVATGADLVAYSGFSASNYLEQPYNSDLDFGTGDFSVMGWHKGTDTGANIVTRWAGGASTIYYQVFITGSAYRFRVRNAADDKSATSGAVADDNVWNHFVAVRSSSTLYLYVNGVLAATTASATADVDDATATLAIGNYQGGGGPLTNGNLALLRISATAPTAEQIKKIYEDEKFLFQENAQATLYGTSDAVTPLAHDEVTDLLHVGTSDGRSVFQGLRRVSNTTTAVGTAISASNNLIVEE